MFCVCWAPPYVPSILTIQLMNLTNVIMVMDIIILMSVHIGWNKIRWKFVNIHNGAQILQCNQSRWLTQFVEGGGGLMNEGGSAQLLIIYLLVSHAHTDIPQRKYFEFCSRFFFRVKYRICTISYTGSSFKSYNAELFLYKPWRPKGSFQFEIIINGSLISFRFIWIPMLWI